MSKSKKIISLLLSVIMIMSVFTIVPFTASAAEAEVAVTTDIEVPATEPATEPWPEPETLPMETVPPTEPPTEAPTEPPTEAPTEALPGGTTGDCSWIIKDGVLTIYGNGKMGDYYYYYSPFDGYYFNSVVIESGVTSIGDYAFSECTGLTRVDIPNSVTSIGNGTFYGCTSLDVTVPVSVTSVGEAAFNGCAGVTITLDTVKDFWWTVYSNTNFTVIVGDDITSLSSNMLSDIHNIKNIIIGNNLTEIEENALSLLRGLDSIKVDEGNKVFDSRNDCNALIKTRSNNLMLGSNNAVIPDTVKKIYDGAFYNCTELTSVDIPDSVTSIGNSAFSGCTGLTSVTIPDSVTSLGTNYWGEARTFYGCTSLASVKIGNSVTEIGASAFSGCTGLMSIDIPDSVTSIGYDAFKGCTGLMSVTIPDSVTSIGSSAFSGCTGLTSIDIPDSVTSIGSSAFYGCTGLTSIDIPDSVKMIDQYTFEGCTGLTSVDIPDSVTSIGYEAFYGCTSLKSVTINSDCDIREKAFYDDDQLTEFRYYGFHDLSGSGVGYFYDLPDEVKVDDLTIYGYNKSIAEKYAADNGFKFVGAPLNTTDITLETDKSLELAAKDITGTEKAKEAASLLPKGESAEAEYDIKYYITDNDGYINNSKSHAINFDYFDNTKTKFPCDGKDYKVYRVYTSSNYPDYTATTYIKDMCAVYKDGCMVIKGSASGGVYILASYKDTGITFSITGPEAPEIRVFSSDITGTEKAKTAAERLPEGSTAAKVYDIARYELDEEGLINNSVHSSYPFRSDWQYELKIPCDGKDYKVFYTYVPDSGSTYDTSVRDMNAVYENGFMVIRSSISNGTYMLVPTQPSGSTVKGTITSYVDDSDVTVKLTGVDNNFTAETKGKGDYSIANVPAGEYTLTVSKDNHITREYTVTVTDADVTQDVKVCPKGDVNGDGETDIMDCSVAQRYIRELTTLDAYQIACGDVSGTGDGELDIQDVSRILRHIRELAMLY